MMKRMKVQKRELIRARLQEGTHCASVNPPLPCMERRCYKPTHADGPCARFVPAEPAPEWPVVSTQHELDYTAPVMGAPAVPRECRECAAAHAVCMP